MYNAYESRNVDLKNIYTEEEKTKSDYKVQNARGQTKIIIKYGLLTLYILLSEITRESNQSS